MMKYRIKSDRAQVVAGLAVFQKDEEKVFDEEAAKGYQLIAGVPLSQGNVPQGLEVTIEIAQEGDK